MAERKHTPRPWSIERWQDDTLIIRAPRSPLREWPRSIVHVSLYETEYEEDKLAGKTIWTKKRIPTAEADAHLIAAAPDMAEALADYVHAAFETGTSHGENPVDPDGELLGRMKDALSKARGDT